jgi:hypothetical protein
MIPSLVDMFISSFCYYDARTYVKRKNSTPLRFGDSERYLFKRLQQIVVVLQKLFVMNTEAL